MSLRWTFPPLPDDLFVALEKKSSLHLPAIFTRVHNAASKCMQITNFKAGKANRALAIKSRRDAAYNRDATPRKSKNSLKKEIVLVVKVHTIIK